MIETYKENSVYTSEQKDNQKHNNSQNGQNSNFRRYDVIEKLLKNMTPITPPYKDNNQNTIVSVQPLKKFHKNG